MYGSCELKWTAYLTVLFYLLVVAGGAIAVLNAPDIVNYWNDVGCKGAALGDDLVNGRMSPSVQNRFFVGLVPLSTALTAYRTDLGTFFVQNSNVNSE